MPETDVTTAIIAELITTLLNVLKMRIAERAGKIISAETRSAPTMFIASTITTAVIIASARL